MGEIPNKLRLTLTSKVISSVRALPGEMSRLLAAITNLIERKLVWFWSFCHQFFPHHFLNASLESEWTLKVKICFLLKCYYDYFQFSLNVDPFQHFYSISAIIHLLGRRHTCGKILSYIFLLLRS